jgi:hypothetical protein
LPFRNGKLPHITSVGPFGRRAATRQPDNKPSGQGQKAMTSVSAYNTSTPEVKQSFGHQSNSQDGASNGRTSPEHKVHNTQKLQPPSRINMIESKTLHAKSSTDKGISSKSTRELQVTMGKRRVSQTGGQCRDQGAAIQEILRE